MSGEKMYYQFKDAQFDYMSRSSTHREPTHVAIHPETCWKLQRCIAEKFCVYSMHRHDSSLLNIEGIQILRSYDVEPGTFTFLNGLPYPQKKQ
jgi:hypothetical protein